MMRRTGSPDVASSASQQVRRLGVAVAVLGQVVADAVAEPLLPEVLLEHAEERAALLVGEHVEHAVGVLGETTSNSTGRVLARLSVSKAAVRSRLNVSHRFQSGRKASHAATSMKVAKASLSQMPFHHRIVTRSPNHMWASSWATTSATSCSSLWVGSIRIDEQHALAEGDAARGSPWRRRRSPAAATRSTLSDG